MPSVGDHYIFLEFIDFTELKVNFNDIKLNDNKLKKNNNCKRILIYSLIFMISVLFPLIEYNLGILKLIFLPKKREKKRRETINFILGEPGEMISTMKKNGSFGQENISNKTSFFKGVKKIVSEYNIINVYGINKQKKINIKNSVNLKLLTAITNFLLFINLWSIILSNIKIFSIKFKFSNITLRINGTGTKDVFNSNFNAFKKIYYPNQVYINGIQQNIVKPSYILNKTNNFVELIWNNPINSCRNMFGSCYSITEIDLSNFDSSQVNDAQGMFYLCHSLISINLSNFNTSQVKNMRSMFNESTSLISINLSSFRTSKVTTMAFMFKFCYSLSSIDLSNFDISQVEEMQFMFQNCKNLEYINMNNFNDTSLNQAGTFFGTSPENIVVCINESINNKIFEKIRAKKCYVIDCSNEWKSKQKKIINGTKQCI